MRKVPVAANSSDYPEIILLMDSIESNNPTLANESIQSLIRKRVHVKVSFKERKVICDSHSDYYPNECRYFNKNLVLYPLICQNGHKFCEKCIEKYVVENFITYKFKLDEYNCMFCKSYSIPNTLLLTEESLFSILYNKYGNETINGMLNFSPTQPAPIQLQSFCSICNSNNNNIFMICTGGHLSCNTCALNWAKKNPKLKCFVDSCTKDVNCSLIIQILSQSKLLPRLKPLFREVGINYNTCVNCLNLINLDYSKINTKCPCGTEICNNCERKAHEETCFYYESDKEFEVIDLTPPADISRPSNLKEQEYIKAKYAFENFLEAHGQYSFKSAKLIVNKTLEKRYFEKKKKMIGECKGVNNIGEVYIWHGSKAENYPKIMEEGLKVGGIDYGVDIKQGDRFGFGVYSSTTPDTPIAYAKPSNFIIACLAMKGILSKVKISDKNLLDTGETHSFKPVAGETEKNWHVFFTKEQVLPRFLVEFQS